jgi:hypothetical protein
MMHSLMKKEIAGTLLFIFLFTWIALSGCMRSSSRYDRELDRFYEGLRGDESTALSSYAGFIKYGTAGGDYLIKKLKTENGPGLRQTAVEIIGLTGCSDCANELTFYLNDPYWRVRFFTLDTLDKLNYGKIREALREAIEKDPHESVKLGAIMLLGKKKNADDALFLQALKEKNMNNEKILKAVAIALTNRSNSK